MKQLRLSGSGGQGVITAAIIMSEAAVREGRQVVQSQSYGPEARGGASKAEVVIDERPIYHPKITTPDVVLAMTQKAADKYYRDLPADGLLVLDDDLVPDVPEFANVIKVPITKLAVEKVGKALYANIVALGLMVKLTNIVDFATVKQAVADKVPAATVEENMLALQVGYDSVE